MHNVAITKMQYILPTVLFKIAGQQLDNIYLNSGFPVPRPPKKIAIGSKLSTYTITTNVFG